MILLSIREKGSIQRYKYMIKGQSLLEYVYIEQKERKENPNN
jgi:hypothetical protein